MKPDRKQQSIPDPERGTNGVIRSECFTLRTTRFRHGDSSTSQAELPV